jgi:D-3-phosphoglycerate dehydrogenase
MKVLIADKFEESGIAGLKEIGCEIVYSPDLKDDSLVEAVRESQADVLVVRSTRVSEAALAAGRLRLVVRAGAGYNTIDVKAASARGIYVSNCPGKNSIAVAELAFALILALDRRLRQMEQERIRQGARAEWADAGFDRPRADRPRDDRSREGLRNACHRMEPQPDA